MASFSIQGSRLALLFTALVVFQLALFMAFFRLQAMSPLTKDNRNLSVAVPSQQQLPLAYQSAILVLRCFTTPGCFRSLKCRSGLPPTKIKRRKKWEEQAFCTEDVKTNDCLVYSFGIHSSAEWEEKMAKFMGCEVHAFDPTEAYPSDKFPGVTFHQWGLQGGGTNMSQAHGAEYSPIDATRLRTLDQIMGELKHDSLDVLMLDCEGCEWGVMRDMWCSDKLPNVNQLLVEFHFQKNLGLWDESDVYVAAQAIACLDEARFGIVSIEKSGAGLLNAQYANRVEQVLHGLSGVFLMTVALQRIPESEPLPRDRMKMIAEAGYRWQEAFEKCVPKYGENPKLWNATARRNGCDLYEEAGKKRASKTAQYEKIVQNRVQFDVHERFDEKEWVRKHPPTKQD